MSENVRTSLIVGAITAVATALVLSLPFGVLTASILAGVSIFVVIYLRATRRLALFTATGLAAGLGVARAIPVLSASFQSGKDISLRVNVGDASSAAEWPVVVAIALLLFYEVVTAISDKFSGGEATRKSPHLSARLMKQSGSPTRSPQFVIGDVSNATINIGNDFAGLTEGEAANAVQAFDAARVPAATATGSANAEIDSIAAYMKEGRQDIALELFLKLKRHRFDSLTPRERFRVSANLGYCYLALDRPAEASKFFREAKNYQPDDEQALALEAFGYSLIGDGETALRLAEAVTAKYPTCVKAVAVRIQHLPPGTPFAEVIAGIDAAVRNDGEVLYVLGRRAQADGLFDDAVRFLREALSQTGADAAIRADLAALVVDRVYRGRPDKFRPPQLSPADEFLVRDAVDLLTGLIDEAGSAPLRIGLARFRYNRAMALAALGEDAAAADDFRAACDLSPADPQMVLPSAFHLRRHGDHDGAIGLLLRLLDRQFDATATAVVADWLMRRGKPDDRAKAIARLSDARDRLKEIPSEHRLDLFLPYLTLLTEAGRTNEAEAFLDSDDAKAFTPVQAETLWGYLALQKAEASEARDRARAAAGLLGESPDPADAEPVADILTKLEDFTAAFAVWTKVVGPNEATYRTIELLRCAKEAKEDLFVIERCKSLRAAGHYTAHLLQLEINTLFHYDAIPTALAVIAEAIARDPDSELSRFLRFHRSSIGYRTGRFDLIERDRTLLPAAEEVAPENLPQFTAVYCKGPGHRAAAEMLYGYIRRHPNDPEGLKAYVMAVGMGDPAEEFAPPAEAGPGAAVLFVEEGKEVRSWCIIEDADEPDPDRDEFPPTHRLAQELRGKRPGDRFTLQNDDFAKRTGEVLAIIDKHVYRRNVIRETWGDRFPDVFFIKAMEMPTLPDGTTDFAPLLAHLDRQHENLQALQELYRKHPLPVVSFAKRTNGSVTDALRHVSANDDLRVRCCHGTDEESKRAIRDINDAKRIVLEPLAAATLFVTGAFRRLPPLPFEVIVTEGTVQEFRGDLVADTRRAGESGHIGKGPHGYFAYEWRTEDIDADRAALAEFVGWLTTRCTVVDGLSLAGVKPDARQKLESLFDAGSAQSVAHAAAIDAPVWCDDLALAEVSRELIGTRRVWTAVIADVLAVRRIITDDERTAIFTDLVSRGYWFTPMTPAVFALACQRAGWTPETFPLPRACRWFAEPTVNPVGLMQVFVGCLLEVRRLAPLEHQRDRVSNSLCEHLARHPSGRTILKVTANNVDALFGVDVLGAKRYAAVLRRWAAGDGGGIKLV